MKRIFLFALFTMHAVSFGMISKPKILQMRVSPQQVFPVAIEEEVCHVPRSTCNKIETCLIMTVLLVASIWSFINALQMQDKNCRCQGQ